MCYFQPLDSIDKCNHIPSNLSGFNPLPRSHGANSHSVRTLANLNGALALLSNPQMTQRNEKGTI